MKQHGKPKQFIEFSDRGPLDFEPNESILDVALRHEIDINHECGGMGSCGTCHIFVTDGLELFGPRNDLEQERASDMNFAVNERLACQNLAKVGIKIKLPPKS